MAVVQRPQQAMPAAAVATKLPFVQLFAASATAASVGEVLTLPFDTCKVRLQLQGRSSGPVKYRGTLHTLTTVAREEGVRSLWKGLVPGLHRQVLLGGVRIASYDPIRDFYGRLMREEGGKTSLPTKVAAALTAGTLAVLVGNPTDCLKVRMQAQGKLPPGTPPKYPSALQAYSVIVRHEGVKALWTGTTPNILRNSVVNAAELATYDQIKQALMHPSFGFQDNVYCHLSASLCAGFIAVTVASPFDVVKSRAMALSQQGGYKGVGDVVVQTFREGPLAFWSGFGANFLRLGSWNIAMFVTLEQLRRLMGAAPAKH